jgi:hypothetical protein
VTSTRPTVVHVAVSVMTMICVISIPQSIHVMG